MNVRLLAYMVQNRLGSNSLAELVVLGRVAGEYAAQRAAEAQPAKPCSS